MQTPEKVLHDIFGYTSFRSIQKDVIDNVLQKKDSLAIMPTGGGKSICYQIPALIFEGVTLVISPLISLMKDQLDQLHELGIPAGMLNSSMPHEEYQATVEQVRNKQIKMLYCAPETLLQQRTIALLQSVDLSLIAVDEAHCISEWGHEFRPEYRRIIEARRLFPQAVCIALTATATTQVRSDIAKILAMDNSDQFVAGFDRPNLFIEVIEKSDAAQQALDFIMQFKNQAGIVYCFSRKLVDELTTFLQKNGVSARPYHAGLSDEIREENQELFRKDDISVIVATVAFGMGINKPDIRFVLHHDLPQNIEGYYQQIGRAGRDGLDAHCRALFSHGDAGKIQFFINQKSDSEKNLAYNQLHAILSYMESRECRRKPLLAYFADTPEQEQCGSCDNCVTPPPPERDYSVEAQKFLSCILRMEQRYGASLIIDILRGSKSAKVKSSGGMEISTYGIGKEFSKAEWMMFYRQLSSKGLIQLDLEFGALKVTPEGVKTLKGEQPFLAHISAKTSKRVRKGSTEQYGDEKLFELLRVKRKDIATEEGVPPYAVFPDKTLMEMSLFLPKNNDDLLLVHGVGKVKLERFGEEFLRIVRDYCEENEIASERDITERRTPKRVSSSAKTPKYKKSVEMYQSGMSTSAIAEHCDIKSDTVINHLAQWVTEGNPLDCDSLLEEYNISDELCFQAHSLFEQHGVAALKPTYDAANGDISYDILKLLRMWYIAGQR